MSLLHLPLKKALLIVLCLGFFSLYSVLFSPLSPVEAAYYRSSYPITISAHANGKLYNAIDVIGSDFILFNQADQQLEFFYRSGNSVIYSWIIDSGFDVSGIDHDIDNNIYVADPTNHTIKKYTTGTYEFETSYAISTTQGPYSIAVDPATGDIYTATRDPGNFKIIKITPLGVVSTFISDSDGTTLSDPVNLTIANDYVYIANNATPLSGANSGNLVSYKPLSGGSINSFTPHQTTDPVPPEMDAVALIASDINGVIYTMNTTSGANVLSMFSANNEFSQSYDASNYTENNNVTALKGSGTHMYYLRSSAIGGPNVINEYSPLLAQIISPEGLQVLNSTDLAQSLSASGKTGGGMGSFTGTLIDNNTSNLLAEVPIDLNTDLSWDSGSLTFASDAISGKSFVHGLLSQTGIADSSFVLYVPIPTGLTSNTVVICPGASTLEDVTSTCAGGLTFIANGTTVTKYTDPNTSVEYWRVEGMTGTGGISITEAGSAAGMVIKDTMTRLQVSEFSDHSFLFGTVNGLVLATDSIEITFGPDWDLGYLDSFDIDLLTYDVQLPIADSATTDTWGITINSGDGIITLTPPTDGVNYIDALAPIELRIGLNASEGGSGANQIANPGTAAGYTVTVLNTNAVGTEYGAAMIPIVDSDQVNVTSYINTFMTFDIDTGISDTDCDYNTCLTHENGQIGENYTIDLGELNATWVNMSEDVSHMHADGQPGLINAIYLDFTSNAAGGLVIVASSANDGLAGPGGNMIDSVAANGDSITSNSGLYGLQMPDPEPTGNGTINRNNSCILAGEFCRLIQTGVEIASTEGPIDNGRMRILIAAAATAVNNPGTYQDTLTFVVTPTY